MKQGRSYGGGGTSCDAGPFIKRGLEALGQGFSNFFSEGPDETPVQPERARPVFLLLEGGGRICARSPLRPWSRARSRALEALGL